MEESHADTTWDCTESPLPGSPSGANTPHELPLTGASPAVTLQPGETLIVYHPYSQYPMHITPTAELHGPIERTAWHDIKTPGASYTPFPTRADFEQAELFVNSNISNKYIDAQLKLAQNNGMRLKVKTLRKMHKLLAHGVEEDLVDDSKVGSVHSAIEPPHYS